MQDLQRIKLLRKETGLTQKELAQKAGVSQSFVAKVENNLIEPSYERITKVFAVLEELRAQQQPTAGDFMEKNIITCKPEDSLKTVIRRMRKQAISQVPVLEHNVIVGMITESGLLEHALDKNLGALHAEDAMDVPPPIVHANTNRDAVIGLLKHAPLVAVTEKGKLKGIISRADIIRGTYI